MSITKQIIAEYPEHTEFLCFVINFAMKEGMAATKETLPFFTDVAVERSLNAALASGELNLDGQTLTETLLKNFA